MALTDEVKYWKEYFERQAAKGKKLLEASNFQFGGAGEKAADGPSSVNFISPVQKTVNMLEARVSQSNEGQGQQRRKRRPPIKGSKKKTSATSGKRKVKRKGVKKSKSKRGGRKTKRRKTGKKKIKKLKKKISKKQKSKKRIVRRDKKQSATIFS